MAGLKESRLTGHSVRMGTIKRPWQETGEVLRRFSGRSGEARWMYEVFAGEGNKRSAPQELEGGGLVRSAGELSRETGMKPITVCHTAERGGGRAEEWEEVLARR